MPEPDKSLVRTIRIGGPALGLVAVAISKTSPYAEWGVGLFFLGVVGLWGYAQVKVDRARLAAARAPRDDAESGCDDQAQ